MQLTRSVSYAVGILLQLHDNKSGGPMTAARISKGCQFPPRFLYRVLRRLVDAGLTTGISGPGGGYALAKPPSKITMLDVVTAVEGDQEVTLLKPVRAKQRKAIKSINDLSKRNRQAFKGQLKRMTLSRLAKL